MSETEVVDESLNNLFDGEDDAVVDIAEDKPTGETEVIDDKVEDKSETESDKTEETAPPAVEKDKTYSEAEFKAQVSKAKDEKEKRQRLKQENEQLRHQQAQQPVVTAPDAFAEPDKAIEHSQGQMLQTVEDKFFNMSEFHAKRNHKDYAEKSELFFEVLQHDDPSLADKARNAPDICEFIYETAKNHVDMQELNESGGIQALVDKKVTEARLEWETEQDVKKDQAVEDAITKSIPGSLSGKRAAGGNKSKVRTDDTPLDKLFG